MGLLREELSVVYDEAQKHLGTQGMRDFLNTRYRDCTPAEWHRIVAQLIWYRIYTTNIDDVLSFRRGLDREGVPAALSGGFSVLWCNCCYQPITQAISETGSGLL